MRILSLATALMASVYLASDASLAGGTGSETVNVDGEKILLTADDIANVNSLIESTGWDKETVLLHGHGFVLGGIINPETNEPFKTVSEALQEGVDMFAEMAAGAPDQETAVEALRAKHGEALADNADAYGPADPQDADIEAFLRDLFGDDEDND